MPLVRLVEDYIARGKFIFGFLGNGGNLAFVYANKLPKIMAFGPDAVVLAGGITNEGELLLNPLKELIGKTDVEIAISSLQSDAGALGACML